MATAHVRSIALDMERARRTPPVEKPRSGEAASDLGLV
jgi:hypothetical protein